MGSSEYDSMLEIFFSESYELLEEMEQILLKGKGLNRYSKEEVQEIFRIFHTIKADATMMLFEDIAETARAFEKILYFYRDKEEGIEDAETFNCYIEHILLYFTEELEKIEKIGDSSGSSKALIEDILSYKATLVQENEDIMNEKEKQVYYIAGKGKKEKELEPQVRKLDSYIQVNKKQEKNKTIHKYARMKIPDKYDRKKHNIVTLEEMKAVKKIQRLLETVLEGYTKRFQNSSLIAFEEEDLQKLCDIEEQLRHWIQYIDTDDFSDIVAKMTQVTQEMSISLDKDIDLVITGKDIVIEKNKLGKLSNAMIHILRNAIDHGIESKQERIAIGKDPRGKIMIAIKKTKKGLVIKIADDGKGIDRSKILEKAKEQQILNKPETEYSRSEIYELVLQHGFSTNSIITNYSGLGVGLDVAEHNISDLGGRIEIRSEEGQGTEMILYLDA